MSRKERVFGLLVKREKISVRKKSEALNHLLNDYDKMQNLNRKLSILLSETNSKSGVETVQSLRSKAWYGREMAQQKEFTSNRLEFLNKEIEAGRSGLAINKQKERILIEKVIEERKNAAQTAQDLEEKTLVFRNLRQPFS